MSANFHVFAENDLNSVKIGQTHTLAGALNLATQILEYWDDIFIREYKEIETMSDAIKQSVAPIEPYLIVARLSAKGLL